MTLQVFIPSNQNDVQVMPLNGVYLRLKKLRVPIHFGV